MKKYFAVLMAAFLMIFTAVPAFAAAPYDADWVPPVPDFIRPLGVGFSGFGIDDSFLSVDVSSLPPDFLLWYQDTMANYENKSCVCLLDQGVYNRYKEENDIDYDRQFSVYFVFPDKKADGTYYGLGSFVHKSGPQHQEQMNVPSPMLYMCLNNPHSFIKFIYDLKTDKLVLQPSVSKLPAGASLRFTYVLGVGRAWDFSVENGTFSEPSDIYPGFTRVSGKDFGVGTVYHQFVDGKVIEHWRDYDWWLGIEGTEEIPPYNPNLDIDQDTDGDGNPDLNVDTDGDGKPDLNIDTNGDGKPDVNIDTNGDGKPDLNIDTNGDGKPDINIDTNGDGKPDINIDTNGDKKPDINIDTNGDGKADLNIDTNGDGKPDINIDTNGDRKPDLNIDTNGDGKPDINIDTTGDGRPDTNVDIDGDGKPDVNVKPGSSSSGGSSGGSSSSGSSSSSSGSGDGGGDGDDNNPGGNSSGGSSSDKGSGSPDTWFKDSDDNLSYDPWEFFDPFKSDYNSTPWDKNYDPRKSGDSIYSGYDPFSVFNNLLKEMFGG